MVHCPPRKVHVSEPQIREGEEGIDIGEERQEGAGRDDDINDWIEGKDETRATSRLCNVKMKKVADDKESREDAREDQSTGGEGRLVTAMKERERERVAGAGVEERDGERLCYYFLPSFLTHE